MVRVRFIFYLSLGAAAGFILDGQGGSKALDFGIPWAQIACQNLLHYQFSRRLFGFSSLNF